MRAVLAVLAVLAAVGLALGGIGLVEAYHRLPESGDTVITSAAVGAAMLVAVTFYVGLVAIPRRARLRSTPRS